MRIRFFTPILLLAVSGCFDSYGGDSGSDDDSEAVPEKRLDTAQQVWSQAEIADYQFTLAYNCFCVVPKAGSDWPDSYTIAVRSGAIESAFDAATGTYVSDSELSLLPTIDDLFEIIQRAIDAKADKVDVSYDGTYGFPTRIDIDRSSTTIDDEYASTVSGFM